MYNDPEQPKSYKHWLKRKLVLLARADAMAVWWTQHAQPVSGDGKHDERRTAETGRLSAAVDVGDKGSELEKGVLSGSRRPEDITQDGRLDGSTAVETKQQQRGADAPVTATATTTTVCSSVRGEGDERV